MAVGNVKGFKVKKGNETGIAKIATEAYLDESVTKAKLAQAVQDTLDDVGNKADQDGDYDSLTAGGAKQLLSTAYVDDNEPYNFRTAGGSADIGDRMYEEVVGGSIVWNQYARALSEWSFSSAEGTIENGVCTFETTHVYGSVRCVLGNDFINGHKYFISISAKGSGFNTQVGATRFAIGSAGYSQGVNLVFDGANDTTWTRFERVQQFTANPNVTSGENRYVFVQDNRPLESAGTVQVKEPVVIDLTQMFGSTIADYIYSLEQGTAGAGVAWFRKLFPKPYYEYNAGELMSVKAGSHDTVGFNAWDEEWEQGFLAIATGLPIDGGGIRSKNFSPCVPNTAYTMEFGSGSTRYVFWYDADKNFIESATSMVATRVLTSPSNAHFFKIRIDQISAYNNDACIHLAWDGERNGEYEPYEKHTYPLAELELRGIPKLDANNQLYYDGDTYASDGTVTRKYGVRAYQSGDERLADAITDGTNTVYKLSTPTTETADTFVNPQVVDDFGTEEYVDYAYEAGDRDVAIPVGHNSQYMNNLRAKLEMAPGSPSGDGKYIVQQSNGENAYIPYTADGRLDAIEAKLPAPPSTNGTYKLTATVTDGEVTYTWVAG